MPNPNNKVGTVSWEPEEEERSFWERLLVDSLVNPPPGLKMPQEGVETARNIATYSGGQLGGMLRHPATVDLMGGFGLGKEAYDTGAALEEWAGGREQEDRTRKSKEKAAREARLQEAMGTAYQPPTPATPTPATPTPTPGEQAGLDYIQQEVARHKEEQLREIKDLATAGPEEWDRETAERQYNYGGYMDRMAGQGVPAGVLGRSTGMVEPRPPDPKIERELAVAGGLSPTSRAYKKSDETKRLSRGGGLGDAAWRAKKRGQKGAFTASRQMPGADVPLSHIQRTESPVMQRAWMDARVKELGLGRAEAETKLEQARASLMSSEAEDAGLPWKERLQRQRDRLMNIPNFISEKFGSSEALEQKVQDRLALAITAKPSIAENPELLKVAEDDIRNKLMSDNMMNFIQILQIAAGMTSANDPAAGSRALSSWIQNMQMGGQGLTE